MQTQPKELIVTRLRPDLYAQLEKKFSTLRITETVTPLQAGYALGVEAVLKELRNGYVVEVNQ